MKVHTDENHINQVTFTVWPGEQMTLNRVGKHFSCPWCSDKLTGESKWQTDNAKAIRVRILVGR